MKSAKRIFYCFLPCFLVVAASAAHSQSVLSILAPQGTHPAATIGLSASQFGDAEAIDVYVDTVDTLLVVSSLTGTFKASVVIPASAAPGNHFITAIGRTSGDAVQTAFAVTTPWLDRGFGARNLAWNPYENILSTSNISTVGTRWRAAVDAAGATPIVSQGRVYVATEAGIQARTVATGEAIWSSVPTDIFYGTPSVAGGVVYVGGYSGTVYALNGATGAMLWSNALGGGNIYASTAVDHGVVYIASASGASTGRVYALNAATGKILWSFGSGDCRASPTVVNGVVYIGSESEYFYALDAATGGVIWRYRTHGQIDGTAAISAGIAYFGSEGYSVYALATEGQSTGKALWVFDTGASVNVAPAVAYGTVYIGSTNGTMYAIDALYGGLHWQATPDPTSSYFYSAAVANGVLYASSVDGRLTAFNANDGHILGGWAAGHSVLGGPAVSDGVLYTAVEGGSLFALAPGSGIDVVTSERGAPQVSTLRPTLDSSVDSP